jgi:hypothetical protein
MARSHRELKAIRSVREFLATHRLNKLVNFIDRYTSGQAIYAIFNACYEGKEVKQCNLDSR